MSLWSDAASGNAFGAARKGPGHVEAAERVRAWTRERFSLSEDDTVLVTETARSMPGFPPIETVVGFWTGEGTRHHFRVFKPVQAVEESDIPPAWLKAALAASQGIECACC